MSIRICSLLITLVLSFINIISSAQIVSYGDEEEEEVDTVKIVRAAPVFNARGYVSLEDYLEEKLFQDPRTNVQLDAIGATALIAFTIDKYGFVKRANADCSEMRLTLPLQNALDSMPRWKPGIKNDKNTSTRMEFFYRITRVEMGQFVIQQERMPPKFDKTTRNIKIVLVSVCVTALIAAWTFL